MAWCMHPRLSIDRVYGIFCTNVLMPIFTGIGPTIRCGAILQMGHGTSLNTIASGGHSAGLETPEFFQIEQEVLFSLHELKCWNLDFVELLSHLRYPVTPLFPDPAPYLAN
jgi:hypothetical protein